MVHHTRLNISTPVLSLALLSILLVCSNSFLSAQSSDDEISFAYNDAPLLFVLKDLNANYGLRFAYSSRFIPLEEPIQAEVNNASKTEALDAIFEPIPVSYRFIGQQIVLRPQKVEVIEITKSVDPEPLAPQTQSDREERMQALMEARREKWKERLPYLQRRYITNIRGNKALDEIDLADYRLKPGDQYYDPTNDFFSDLDLNQIAAANAQDEKSRLTQVSIVPFLGTNTFSSYSVTNQFSVNLLWGMNGGVKGKEFGGIGNTIKGDVQGVQIAGVFNSVGGDMAGTQISGFGNVAKDTVQGLQISGGFNISGTGTAIQIATLFNAARGDFDGVQASLFYNGIKGSGNALQFSSFINYAGGDSKFQVATLLNSAKDIQTGQIALLFNAAEKVDGFQIGLINVADTISGIPIGLINFIKKGYNRAELFAAETLTGNFALKIGVKQFYNIFTIGARVENFENVQNLTISEMSWSLGYGIGSSIKLGPRFLLNLEAITSHVNEKEGWTKELNQLNQFKVLFDGRFGRKTSLFVGPTLNHMISEIFDPETGEYGTSLAPQTFSDKTKGTRNQKWWIGFNAGLRF